jgi:hypothetical protein
LQAVPECFRGKRGQEADIKDDILTEETLIYRPGALLIDKTRQEQKIRQKNLYFY